MTEKVFDGKFLFSTFLITISPKEDIEDLCVQKLCQRFAKLAASLYVVLEHGKSGKKHLHACICAREKKETRRLQNDFWVIVKKFHPTSIGGIAVKVQVMPGPDWIDDYLRKEDDVTIVVNKWVEDEVRPFYPTACEQLALIAATKKKIGDPYMDVHCLAWEEMFPADSSYCSAICYLRTRMNVTRDMRVIQDLRRLRQFAMALHHYRERVAYVLPGDKRFYDTETTTIDFSNCA